MYRHLEGRLTQHVRDFLRRTYDLALPRIVIEQLAQRGAERIGPAHD